jgi:hypothetical protein
VEYTPPLIASLGASGGSPATGAAAGAAAAAAAAAAAGVVGVGLVRSAPRASRVASRVALRRCGLRSGGGRLRAGRKHSSWRYYWRRAVAGGAPAEPSRLQDPIGEHPPLGRQYAASWRHRGRHGAGGGGCTAVATTGPALEPRPMSLLATGTSTRPGGAAATAVLSS